MTTIGARGWMSMLFHADKLNELLEVAWRSGLLARLDAAPAEGIALGVLAADLGMVPGRLYKALDCLEALGFVLRDDGDTMLATRYRAAEPLAAAAEAVYADDSIERDRATQPFGALQGRLGEVLRGAPGIAAEDFAWPPSTPEQSARFAASMAAGIPPIAESFAAVAPTLFPEPTRILDVGGGNGTLARRLAERHPQLTVHVFELPELEPLANEVFADSPARDRLGFVGGDAIGGELPGGYDVISFVRILHDWPEETARALLAEAAKRADRVVVCEELRTPARLAVQTFWSWFLIGVDGCVSRLREWERYQAWFDDLDFASQLYPGAFDIGVGRRR
ncbi:MAG: ArsR family transcriptional regulator [Sandaracinus sp.]|nr:ArsR family transcriptional regulator [Sandaracinus sp.]|tara:strand:- start:5782 stop:6792 length:1011 start_codon:yes stop_codon:yes gene_type:complete